jgi:hypothetical protein
MALRMCRPRFFGGLVLTHAWFFAEAWSNSAALCLSGMVDVLAEQHIVLYFKIKICHLR